MLGICPATGHLLGYLRVQQYNPLMGGRRSNFSHEPHEETGPNCPEHGVPLFQNCPQCSAPWPVIRPGTPGKRPGAPAKMWETIKPVLQTLTREGIKGL